MRRFITLILLLFAGTMLCGAQTFQKDTLNSGIRNYQDEIGYFQIANRDMGDPLFMFHDEKGRIDLGLGGTAKVSAFYGFAGEVPTTGFNPALITLPTKKNTQFGMRISGTEVHVKARSWIGRHKIIAYVKFGGNDDKSVNVSQAYLSLDGFSIGLIPSFFMDREVGAMTTGMSHNCSIDLTHTLVGYTARLGERIRLGVSAEQPNFSIDYIGDKYRLKTTYQPMPDFCTYFKYKFDDGHLQANAVFRNLTYWDTPLILGAGNGEERHIFGYGGSLSGHIQKSKKLKLSWQFCGGAGITSYLSDLGGLNLDVGLSNTPDEKDHYKLSATPVSSGMISAELNWTDNLASSILVNHTHTYQKKTFNYDDETTDCLSAAVNLFWYMSEYSYFGAEYIFGRRTVPVGNGYMSGIANRLVAVIAFCF